MNMTSSYDIKDLIKCVPVIAEEWLMTVYPQDPSSDCNYIVHIAYDFRPDNGTLVELTQQHNKKNPDNYIVFEKRCHVFTKIKDDGVVEFMMGNTETQAVIDLAIEDTREAIVNCLFGMDNGEAYQDKIDALAAGKSTEWVETSSLNINLYEID